MPRPDRPSPHDDTVEASGEERSGDPTVGDTLPPSSAGPARATVQSGPDYDRLVAVEPRHYALENEIARGGMGRVLRARDRRLGRPVAIKELLSLSPATRVRFEREVRITARLQHPSIVSVLEAGLWPSDEPFYAMQLVTGEPLDQAITRAGTLEARLGLLPNVIAVVDALAYAHAQKIIHRDLKPSNVLVGAYGETVVIDWGLAKDLGDAEAEVPTAPATAADDRTIAGTVVGTPAYMPAEQAAGEAVDARADVYSLGAILYHTLSGRPPFAGATTDEILDKVVAGPAPSVAVAAPGVASDLVAIVDKAMAFHAADRYATASELAVDLKRFQTGQLVGAHRYSGWQLFRRWVRRNRTAVIVGAVATLVLIALGITSILGILNERERTEKQRVAAEQNRARAEDLVGFMLGDLEKSLEPLGQLPLLEVVSRKALAYYADLPTGDRTELRGRATAFLNIGQVFVKQGSYGEAQTQFDTALELRRRLLSLDPLNADLLRDVAAVHNARGDLFRRQARVADAMGEYRAALSIVEPLVARDPKNESDRNLLAFGLERVGWLERERGDLDAALAPLQRSRDLRRTLDPENPAFRLALSLSHDSLGTVLEIRGDTAAALAEYRASLALRAELVDKEPTAMGHRYALAVSHDRIGAALVSAGDSAGALESFRAELRIAELLTGRDETNGEWRELLARAKTRVADVLAERGDSRGALTYYQESIAAHEEAIRRDPSNMDAQHEIAVTYDKVGYVLERLGDVDGALAKFQASKAIREARSRRDPQNVEWQRDLSMSLDGIAEVLLMKGDPQRALATYRENLRLAEAIAHHDPNNGDYQRDVALTHQRIGDVLIDGDEPSNALVELRQSARIFDALATKDANNAQARRDLALNHLKVGTALLRSKDPTGAQSAFRTGRELAKTLLATDPRNVLWMTDLALLHDGYGDAALALRDRDAARISYRAAIELEENVVAADPAKVKQRAFLAELRGKLAAIQR